MPPLSYFKQIICLAILLSGNMWVPTNSNAQTLVSLKQFATKAIAVSNPVNLMDLPLGGIFQINHPKFTLQFFQEGIRVRGIIFKRDPDSPILIRWCFFRNCEESPFDYKAVLAQRHEKPFNEDFFQVMLPAKLKYKFQGMHFTSGFPSKY